jgi:hypothetical protein
MVCTQFPTAAAQVMHTTISSLNCRFFAIAQSAAVYQGLAQATMLLQLLLVCSRQKCNSCCLHTASAQPLTVTHH